MSLAGLDTPAVVEAHQASIADPSGWFLLKYEQGSRDTVEVFKNGTGGITEARTALESYPDKSPLFGMVQYRRRKVILKYVPEGTSRLLQVRLTVQFQSVPDVFPHDVVYSLTSASELTEPALGAQTMLAPLVGSMTSSSSSLRKQRLKDITEDAEDGADMDSEQEAVLPQPPATRQSYPELNSGKHDDGLDDLPASALRAKALLAMRSSPEIDVTDHDELTATDPAPAEILLEQPRIEPSRTPKESPFSTASPPILPPIIPVSSDFDKALPAPPQNDQRQVQVTGPESSETTKPGEISQQSAAHAQKVSPHLTAGESESISLWSSEVAAYAVKPKKKKLGPRPHVEPPGRPRTSGASENSVRTRPVANLPNTVKVSTDRVRVPMSLRPSSQQSSKSVPGRFPSSQSVSNLPPMPSPTQIPHYYRSESRSVVGKTPSLTSEISMNATPEKLRLMKALQMRKRNMIATQRASLSPAVQAEMMQTNTNGHVADPKFASDSTTPTTATIASEHADESSFTSRDDGANRRGSLSSDTSSSITPKAEESEKRKAKPLKPLDAPRRSPKRDTRSRLAAPPIEEVDSDDEIQSKVEILRQVEPVSEPAKSAAKNELPDPLTSRSRLSMSNVAARVKKGLSIPNPIHIPNGADASGESDADSLMDELANATVHEAKPVTVARTPVTPVMSAATLREYGDLNRPGQPGAQIRSKSSNYTTEKPKSSGGRSASGLPQWPPLPAEPSPQPLTKKASLGTGISKRIKALEVLSTRDSTSPPRQPVRDIPSKRSAFDTFMKRSSFVKPEFNTSTDKSPPKKAPETTPLAPLATAAGPRRAVEPPLRGEAVSVTARIIRNDENPPPSTAPGDLNLHRSPLIVEHERLNQEGRAVSSGRIHETPRSPFKQEKGRFSFSSYRSMAQSATQPRLNTADSSSKLSMSSKTKMPRSMSDNSSIVDEKKGSSRAHRLMKRVSNLTGRKSQKNLSSSSHTDFHHEEKPETIDERFENDGRTNSNPESLLHVVDIGDVNVQFPDTLLWKRRFMRIDDQGYLIFSPPANDPSIRNVSRKFHLSDIRTPTLPDLEREQMAWSVFLDMRDGSCIQCACESRAVQQQVLQMLVDAHSAYSQLYGT